MPLPLLSCSLALDDHLITTLLLTLSRSCMATGGAGREGGGGGADQHLGEIFELKSYKIASSY